MFFTGRMPFLPPNQQRESTEGLIYYRETKTENNKKLKRKSEFIEKWKTRVQRDSCKEGSGLRAIDTNWQSVNTGIHSAWRKAVTAFSSNVSSTSVNTPSWGTEHIFKETHVQGHATGEGRRCVMEKRGNITYGNNSTTAILWDTAEPFCQKLPKSVNMSWS